MRGNRHFVAVLLVPSKFSNVFILLNVLSSSSHILSPRLGDTVDSGRGLSFSPPVRDYEFGYRIRQFPSHILKSDNNLLILSNIGTGG
jgi:hypothetical protein